jgi:hypothetical protein
VIQLHRQTSAIEALAASNAALAESNMLLVEALAQREDDEDGTAGQTLDGD